MGNIQLSRDFLSRQKRRNIMSSEPLEWNEERQFSSPCTERCGNVAIYTLTDPVRFEFSR
jgi:hypothetical protein